MMRIVLSGLILMLVVSAPRAQESDSDSLDLQLRNLEKRLVQLEARQHTDELQRLREDATRLSRKVPDQNVKKGRVFKSGQRSLQAINPEISVTGDAGGQVVMNSDGFSPSIRTGAGFRVVGLHVQSALDPFSFTKMALEFTPEEVELGEAYVTWSNLFSNVSLTAGKFRQQFGIVNRWHKHALDQYDFPLALTTLFGPDGLNQTGLSMEWLMPSLTAQVNNLTLEVTNGQNRQLFNGDAFGFPTVLMHYRNYYDLNRNTYLELGLTGMGGTNNFCGYNDTGNRVTDPEHLTSVAGLDLTVDWEPLNRAHYHSLLWRSEFYQVRKQQAGGQTILARGAYSYLEYKLNERWCLGTRWDYTQPFEADNGDRAIYQLVPYLTWWQSHWMRFRLEYDHPFGSVDSNTSGVLHLQLTWAAGPHKHDRY